MLLIYMCREDGMKDLHCMSFTSKGNSEILVAGLQDQMFVIDVEKGTTRRQVKHRTACPPLTC